MQQHIIVIGAGFGGLSAAIRLAAQGHRVEIFEQSDQPGGKAYVIERDGYRFDAGPTVITAPFMFDDLWRVAGRKREEYFELRPCTPYYRLFNHDGNHFDYAGDESAILREIARFNPADVEGYRRFVASTKPIFEKGFVELADKPFLSEEFDNLYFVGAGTHPGAGLPGVLSSAIIAEELIGAA